MSCSFLCFSSVVLLEQIQCIRQRRDEPPIKRRKIAAVPIERIKHQIKREISGVLSLHNVETDNKELLIEDIVYALEELVKTREDAKNACDCRESIQPSIRVRPFQAEEMSSTHVDKARSADKSNTKGRLCVSGKRIKLLERNPKQRTKLGIKTMLRTHVPLVMQFDVIRLPINISFEIKNELKETLRRSVNQIINDSPLPTSRKRILKNKLNNIVDEDIEELALTGKQSIALTRLKTLRQMNDVLLDAPIPKNKKNMFKYKLAEVLSNNLNESLLLKTENYKLSLDNNFDDSLSPESSVDIYYDSCDQESSVLSKTNEGTATYERSKTKRYLVPNHIPTLVNNNNLHIITSSFSNIENRYIFNNSVEQGSAFTTSSNPDIISHDDEIQYTKNILDIVQNWLDAVLITDLATQQKNKVIIQLTQDIVDRKKYHQISQWARTPNQEEDLEYLKLQIFRRLNKLMSTYALKQVIKGTAQMFASIDEIKVPVMTLPIGSSVVLATETLERKKKHTKVQKNSNIFKSLLPQFDVHKSLQEEIYDVLTKQEIDPVKVKHIEDDVVGELKSIVIKDGDVESAKQNLITKIMTEVNLTTEQASDVASKLITRAKEMSLIAKATDSDLYNKIIKSSASSRKRRLTELLPDEFINSPELLHPRHRLYSIGGIYYNIDDENILDEVLKKNFVKTRFKDLTSKLIIEAIDTSLISTPNKISMKENILKNVDENIDKLPLESPQDRIFLREKILEDSIQLIEGSTMPGDQQKYLINILKEALTTNFEKIYNETEGTILRKPSPNVQKANKTQSATDQRTTEVKSNGLLSRIDVDNTLKEEITDVFERYNIDPRELKGVEGSLIDELGNVAVKGNNHEIARNTIINKIIPETNLPKNKANFLADELIGRARELSILAKATDSDTYNEYIKSSNFGRRRRLTELSDKEFFDSPEKLKIHEPITYLIDGVQYEPDDESALEKVLKKKVLKNQFLDALSKLVDDTIDKSTISDPEKKFLKSNLTSKLKEDLENAPIDSTTDRDEVKGQILKDCSNIVYGTSLPIDEKQEIIFSLTDIFTNKFEALYKLLDRNNSSENQNSRRLEKYDTTETEKVGILSSRMRAIKDRSLSIEKSSDNTKLSAATKTVEQTSEDIKLSDEVIATENENITPSARKASDDRRQSTDKIETSKEKRPSSEDGRRASTMRTSQDISSNGRRTSDDQRSSTPTKTSEGPIITNEEKKPSTEDERRESPMRISKDDDDEENDRRLSTATKTSEGKRTSDERPSTGMEASEDRRPSRLPKLTDSEEDPNSDKAETIIKTKLGELDDTMNDELDNVFVNGSNVETVPQNFKDIITAETNLPEPGDVVQHNVDNEHAIEIGLKNNIEKKQFKETLSKDIDDVIDKVSLTVQDQNNLKASINNKLDEIIDREPFDGDNDRDTIKEEILKDGENIINDTSLAENKKGELKILLRDALLPNAELSCEMMINGKSIFQPNAISTQKRVSLTTQVMHGPEGQEYMDKLTDCVKEWLEYVPVQLEPENKSIFTDALVMDLVDRQKYLKLSNDTFTKKDENDNLKYQIYKRLSKAVDAGAIPLVMQRTDSLFRRKYEIPVPNKLPTVSYADQNKLTYNKKRRRNSQSRPKRRIATGLPIEKIKEPLKEEISDILIKHKVRPSNANKLIEDIFYRLEDLAANVGDPFDATISCSKSLLLEPHTSGEQTRKSSNKRVDKARETSLILQTKSSKEQLKLKSNSFKNTKEIFTAPETIRIKKNKRPVSVDVNFIEKADADIDNVSVKMDVIKVPKDQTLSAIKDQIKNALYRNIKQILTETALPSSLGYKLRDNLNNAVEKNLNKFVLKEKMDVDNLKQVILEDMYDVIDDSPITKNDSEMFKSKLTEAVDKHVNEVILTDNHVENERLSKNLNDVIPQLPISGTEKHDLKNTLTTIYCETEQIKNNELFTHQKRASISKKNFAPKANSTFKNGDHLEMIEETQATNDTRQKTGENKEKGYMEEVIDIVKAWLEKIPVDMEISVKETFVNELADDIVNRKNYVSHAPTKPSFTEDLEYLKIQVLQRTTDFLTPELQKLVLGNCKTLLKKIKEILTPGVTGPLGLMPQGKLQSEMEEGGAGLPSAKVLKDFQDSLLREMDSFLGPLDMTSEEKEKLKRTLLNDLDRLLKNNTDPDIMMQQLIATIKRLTNLSDEEAVELARRLMNKTKEKGFLPRVCCSSRRLSFASEAVCVQRKAFRDAILREIGDGFFGCNISEEKKQYLEDLLIEDYAKEYGIILTECCPTGDVGDENEITTIVNDWISTIPVTMRDDQEYTRFVQQKNDLIPKIKESLPASDYGSIREDARTFLLKIPLHPDFKENEEQQNKKIEDLIDKFLCLPPKAKGHRYGMSFSGLTNYIDSWIDNIHITDDTRDEEAMKDLKKDMTYSLVHKLGEMNIDPEIFNDDSLYEEVLRDELQNMLGDVTITDANIQALKDDLIDKVKSAQQRAHDEIIGQNYKHKLRHAMTNILPASCTMSREEHAAMELLKEQLADAFIDLNYSGNDENLATHLKSKITNEIQMFCNNYLSSHPAAPLSNKQLNLELFNALTSVPLPSGDSIRYEVEQARIREVINEWIKDLPLQSQNPSELLARNRLIYVLSKKLFDIETEVEDSPDELMRKEIMKLLNKMPLKPENDNNSLANNLIEKLNLSKESRRFDDGSDDIDAYGNICDSSCPIKGRGGASSNYRRTTMPQERPCSRRATYPPCTLSPEDKAHLDRIRRRSCVTPNCVKALLKNNKCSAAVGLHPIDAQSQTELRAQNFENGNQIPVCTGTNEKMTRPCPGMSSLPQRSPCGLRRHTVSSSRLQGEEQDEIQPQVAIKKYYWDSTEKSNFQDSESHPARAPYSSSFLPSRAATCHPPDTPCQRPTSCQRPNTPSFHRKQPETVPCQAGTPPYKKSSQSPYHRDCYKHDNLQPSTSPHRVPCNYDHSITQGIDTKPTKPVGRFYHWSPQRSFQERISQPSQRSTPRSRSPAQSPCMSRSPSPCRMNHESTPLSFSNRVKRNGLQEQIPCTSSRPSRKERVTELGSLDDVQHPRAKKNTSNSFDWSNGQFPEEDSFWGTPCMRRVIMDEGIDEPLVMEREEREERVSCKCKETVFPKATRTSCMFGPRDQDGRKGNNLHRCSKCCGVHCPYPSFLYFRE